MNTSFMVQVIKLKILSLWNLAIHSFYPKTGLNLATTSQGTGTENFRQTKSLH